MLNEQEAALETKTLNAQVDSITVGNQADYDSAMVLDLKVRQTKKAFHVWFDPIDETSKKARQSVIAQGKAIDEPLDYAIKVLGNKTGIWYRAEQTRIADERRKAEEIARKAAEEAAIKAAEQLQEAGMTAAAEAVLDAPIVSVKIEIAQPAKADGASYRDSYSAECVDLMALVVAVASGTVPVCYLQANAVALNGWARATKGTEAIAGVKVVTTTTTARRI
jgi:hypothetical protein